MQQVRLGSKTLVTTGRGSGPTVATASAASKVSTAASASISTSSTSSVVKTNQIITNKSVPAKEKDKSSKDKDFSYR